MAELSNRLSRYTAALRKISETRELNHEEVYNLQREYDLSPQDVDLLNENIQNHLNAASVYFENGDWNNAILELNTASEKDPLKPSIQERLAVVYFDKMQILGENKEDARAFNAAVKRLNSLSPLNTRGRNLQMRFNKERKRALPLKKILLIILTIPAILLLIWLFLNSAGKDPFNMGQKGKNGQGKNPQNETEEFMEIWTGEKEIGVHVIPRKDEAQVEYEVRKSLLTGQDDYFTYTLHCLFKSPVRDLSRLDIRVIWYNSKNKPFYEEKRELISDSGARKDDLVILNHFKSSARRRPDLYYVEVVMDTIQSTRALSYPLSDEIKIQWETQKDDLKSLSLRERNRDQITGFNGNYLFLTLESYNSGKKDIEELTATIQWLDEQNQIFEEEEISIIGKNGVVLKPEETRISEHIINSSKNLNEKNYTILLGRY